MKRKNLFATILTLLAASITPACSDDDKGSYQDETGQPVSFVFRNTSESVLYLDGSYSRPVYRVSDGRRALNLSPMPGGCQPASCQTSPGQICDAFSPATIAVQPSDTLQWSWDGTTTLEREHPDDASQKCLQRVAVPAQELTVQVPFGTESEPASDANPALTRVRNPVTKEVKFAFPADSVIEIPAP